MAQQEATGKRTPVNLNRDLILQATARCLGEVGYDGTTIRRIATTLDCAVGSIYRYFKDKRELLSAVCQKRFEGALAIVQAGGSVEQSAAAYADAALDSPEAYRLMFWLASVGQTRPTSDTLLPEIVVKIISAWSERLSHQSSAERAWLVMHGAVMIGADREGLIEEVRTVLDGTPEVAGAIAGSISNRKTSQRPRLVSETVEETAAADAESPSEQPADAALAAKSAKGDDDVTLL